MVIEYPRQQSVAKEDAVREVAVDGINEHTLERSIANSLLYVVDAGKWTNRQSIDEARRHRRHKLY
jgi:hypothetical protein